MDPPSEWPLWLKLLCGWGPLGIWAARAELARSRSERALARSEREHHKTRDAHDKLLVDRDAKIREAEAARDAAHREDARVLTDQFVRLIEYQSRQANRLADGVDKKTKKRRGLPDDHDQGDQGGQDGGGGDGA